MIVAQYFCPFCGYFGQIGFRLCSDNKTIVLLCNECDAVWLSPEQIDAKNFISVHPDCVIPGTECSVQVPKSRWATRDEVIQYGWEKFIADEDEAMSNFSFR